MKKIYERPDAAVTVFGSADMTNAITISSVFTLKEVAKDDDNTVTFPAAQ